MLVTTGVPPLVDWKHNAPAEWDPDPEASYPLLPSDPKCGIDTKRYWKVSTGSIIEEPDYHPSNPKAKYDWIGIEVISPILTDGEDDYGRVARAADLPRTELRSKVNKSFELHIHVGLSPDKATSYDLPTVQNLLASAFTFEPASNSFDPPYRGGYILNDTSLAGVELNPKSRYHWRPPLRSNLSWDPANQSPL